MYKLYRETMEELRAPQETLEEIIAMTEKKKKKRSVRPLLAAAAAVAALTVGAGAANLESVQEFLYEVISMNEVDVFRTDLTTEGGDIVLFDMTKLDVQTVDGRVVLTAGDEKLDITEELAENGTYAYDKTLEGTRVQAVVTGAPEEYEVVYSMGRPGEEGPEVRYTVTDSGEPVLVSTDQDGDGSAVVSVYAAGEDGDIDEISIGFANQK